MQAALKQDTLSPLAFHVVFLATSTQEKIRDLNIIADKKRLPLKFYNLADVAGTLHNTLENGKSATDNALLKLRGAQAKIDWCRHHPEEVEAFCHKRGIENYDAKRIWYGTEDSGFYMPQEIWQNLPKELFKLLPDKLRKELKKMNTGPARETAPFLSAMLGTGNIGSILEAGLNGYMKTHDQMPQLIFKDECVLALEPMLPSGENDFIKARALKLNEYAREHYEHPDPVAGNIGSYGYFKPIRLSKANTPYNKMTAAELGVDFIAKHSARAAAVDELVRKINLSRKTYPEHQLHPVEESRKNDLVIDIAVAPDNFRVGIVNAPSKVESDAITDELLYNHAELKPFVYTDNGEPKPDASVEERATYHLSAPERMFRSSDGLILMPDSAREEAPMSLNEKLYLLSSIVVAKQLIQRDKHKPVVILNTDHSWDEALKIHSSLAGAGMTKDNALMISPKFRDETLPEEFHGFDVSATTNGYFTVINGGHYEHGVKAASFLIKDASLSYHHYPDEQSQTSARGKSPAQCAKNFKGVVAVFCSAGSENSPLNKYVKHITADLAKAGRQILCGGGDRYTMGAILDGMRKYRGKLNLPRKEAMEQGYIAGFSTQPIANSETDLGEISADYSYAELTKDIYERMAKMMVPADTILVAPGGAGTMQEWMGFNLLKEKMPEFKDKKLVIFDPVLLGKQDAKKHVERLSQSMMQHKVFDKALKIIFPPGTTREELAAQNIQVASSQNDALNGCLGKRISPAPFGTLAM